MVALILAVIASPVLTWAVSQFVLLPSLRSAIEADPDAAEEASTGHGESGGGHGESSEGHGGGHGEGAEEANKAHGGGYRFENLVVNLAGTMGTRYLKTSFVVSGKDPSLYNIFVTQKIPLTDEALDVLSSLSLADLEEVGARDFIRERLMRAFNRRIGRPVAEEIFFIDFVVQ